MLQSTENRQSHYSKNYMQWLCTLTAFVINLQVSIQFSWSSPNIPRLTGENSPIPITKEEASWLLSLTALSGFVTVFIAAVSVECLGSKKTVILALVTFSVSHVCILCASTVEMLYAGRILGGSAIVFGYSCFSFYIGEVAAPSIRGTLISVSAAGISIGSVFGTVVETYVDRRRISSSIYLAICLATIILAVCLKNTPYYFVKRGDYDNAKKSIAFYGGHDEDENIFEEVKKYIDAQSNCTFKGRFQMFRLPAVRRSIFLLAILAAMPSITGLTTLTGYMETIFTSAKVTLIKPEESVVYINIISASASLTTVRLMDILGRRVLLIISSVGTSVAMAMLGTHFCLIKANFNPENLQWIPLFALVLYLIALSVGFVTVPSAVLSEFFPEQLKSVATFVQMSSSTLSAFITSATYQLEVNFAGEMYVFWMYAVFASLAIPCALFLMPETKGKSFQEIQEILMKK